MTETNLWMHSDSPEGFGCKKRFPTRQAAYDAAKNDCECGLHIDVGLDGRDIWTGRFAGTPVVGVGQSATMALLDDVTEEIVMQHGGMAEDWADSVNSSRKLVADLAEAVNAAFMKALKEHGLEPDFWTVDSVERHDDPIAEVG